MITIQINDKMRLVFSDEDEEKGEVFLSYEIYQKKWRDDEYMWTEMDVIEFDNQAQVLDWIEACERLKKLLVLK